MRTKTRTRLYRAANETAGEARHDAGRTGQGLAKALKVSETRGVGEAAETLQHALGEHLAALAQELADAEDQEYRRRDRARELRRTRDEQTAELAEWIKRARGVVTIAYGETAIRRYFGRGKTPRQADELVELAARVVERLRKTAPPAEPRTAVMVDTRVFAESLEQVETALRATLAELRRLEAGARRFLLNKRRLERQLEHAQQDAARILGGMYRLAGQGFRDERVRKVHRKRRLRRKKRAPATASSLPASSTGASGTEPMVHTSASGAPGTSSSLPGSPSGTPVTRSTVPTSAAGAPGTSSSSPGSSSGAPVRRSSDPSSRSGAVSERRATGEAAEIPAPERDADETRPWHPVRRRRATGVTASHPLPEQCADGESPALPDPGGEATDMAA